MTSIDEKYKMNSVFLQARTLAFSSLVAKDATRSGGWFSLFNPFIPLMF